MPVFHMLSSAVLLGLLAACAGDAVRPPVPPPPPPPGPPPPPSGSYQVAWSTFLGGADDEELREPVLLSGGRLLLGARTRSANMPTTAGAWQRSISIPGESDMYLALLGPGGDRLEAATFFGGSGGERTPYGIAVTAAGDIVFTTGTASPDIPMTAGAYRSTLAGNGAEDDGFVCRISPDLASLRWCTYIGAWPRGGLALDAAENVVVTGHTTIVPFVPTAGAVQNGVRGVNDAFVMKLAADGSRALWATPLGGSNATNSEVGVSIRVLPSGEVSIVGISYSADFPTTPGSVQRTSTGAPDAFVARLSADGSTLRHATLAGGSGLELTERRHDVQPDGTVRLAGVTASTNLPSATNTLSGQNDGFVIEIRPDGGSFGRVRYLGGSGDDHVLGPVVDAAGLIYLFGSTDSPDFPVTADALQRQKAGGRDVFLTILNPDLSLRYGTYLGGSGDELVRGVAVDTNGDVYLIGGTASPDFPVTTGSFQRTYGGGPRDGFVVKLRRSP